MNSELKELISACCEKSIIDTGLIDELRGSVIYVTGCGGFVGRWLLELILHLNEAYDFKIKVFATTRIWDLDNKDLTHLFNHDYFIFSDLDVRNTFSIPDEVTKVIHLAGSPDRKEIASDPLKLINTVVQGTTNILDAVNEHGKIEKILNFTSGYVSAAKYINDDGVLSYSFDDPSKLMAVYSDSKRMSEVLANVYKRRYQLNIQNIRPYAFVGPFMNLNKVWAINNFFLDAINNNNIVVNGDKRTVRSYMFAPDMAFSTLFCLSNHDSHMIELGSVESVTLESLAAQINNLYSNNKALILSDVHNERHEVNIFMPATNGSLDSLFSNKWSKLNESLYITKKWKDINESN